METKMKNRWHIVKEAFQFGVWLSSPPDPQVIPTGGQQIREDTFLQNQQVFSYSF